jgi:hypothetical protein
MVPIEMVLGLAGVPLIVALVEATKLVVPELRPRWFPLVALTWALCLNAGVGGYLGGDPILGALTGLVAALAAVGLYSGGKALAG